jgi:hypothetical protein
MHPDFKKNVLFIDNTNPNKNLGIMRSHNMGVDFMRQQGADWLIIISAAIRFGALGGLDFIRALEDHPEHYIIHAGTPNHPAASNIKAVEHQDGEYKNGVFGWHLTAFKKDVFDNIGVWDENFSRYGLDDLDLSLRVQKHYKNAPGWGTFPVDVGDVGMSHSINKAGVRSAYPPRNDYFRRKWGRDGSDWQNDGYSHPFNDPSKSLSYWPLPDDPRSIHKIEFAKGEWSYDD